MTLQDLITAVEGAEAGSRELDALVGIAIRDDYPHDNAEAFLDGMIRDRAGPYYAKHYTTSLDAAVALIERKLPGWCWRAQPTTASLVDDESETPAIHAEAASAPLALCAALLRALQSPAQENRKDVS